jgi:hypothetical protein
MTAKACAHLVDDVDLPWDEAKAPAMPAADAPHVAAFGAQDATCLEWSDACQICIRKTPGDEVQCSTAGFACVAEAPVCRRR